ncbi:MAG: N-acetylmuramoyl-L-alanine amidase, partial [Lachnospiraceae bacterium]|nr:N-acetylmuramoyl-L-alanine amidase [Lachnospiraceae bacterium]
KEVEPTKVSDVVAVTNTPTSTPTATPTTAPTDTPVPTATDTPVPTVAIEINQTEEPVPTPPFCLTKDPNRKARVLIDAGHGGHDGGTDGDRKERDENGKKIWECDITLLISLLVRDKLEAAGVEVIMVRDKDVYPGTPTERVELGSSLDIDCLVSIHLNASDHPEVSGTEVWYCDGITGNADYPTSVKAYVSCFPEEEQKAVEDKLLKDRKKLAQLVLSSLIEQTGSKDRGIRPTKDLALTKCANPSCLVECEFLSSDDKYPLLITPEYQDTTATGITNGIIKFLDYLGALK